MKLYSPHWLCLALLFVCSSCSQQPQTVQSEYIAIQPEYSKVQISLAQDTISFPLDEETYNKIKTFNLFTDTQHEKFIAFYDKRSVSVNIYHLTSKKKAARIDLKKLFDTYESQKISTYVHTFDSIFINTNKGLVLIDSTGKKLKTIPFLKKPKFAWAEFDSNVPPFVKDGHLYASVSPYVNAKSVSAVKKWRIIYDFDLKRGTASLLYRLPPVYYRQLDGQLFLNHSYCINDKERFVLSFTVDTCIYETNLREYHKAYLGKSRYQQTAIMMGNSGTDTSFKQKYKKILSNDTYGSIYFDPYKKRYLRIMYARLSEAELAARKKTKQTSMIIFDEHFKIIGESIIPTELYTSSIFFSPDGKIYARVNVNDQQHLQFVRLAYSDENQFPKTLSQHPSP